MKIGHPALLRVCLAACAPALLSGAPTVFNIRTSFVSHSAIGLVWDNSQLPNAARLRFGLTTAYEAGRLGGIFVPDTDSNGFFQYGLTISMSGMAAGTTYHLCPQSSTDGGLTWSECNDFVVTLPALPSPHPAPPAAAIQVDTTYPVQTGATLNVAADCSDLQAALNTAQYGDVVLIPAGAVCTGAYVLPNAPEAKTWQASGVKTSTATIALPGHGFSDGQWVRIGANGYNGDALPGTAGANVFVQLRGIKMGTDYYIRLIDQDHFQLAATRNGPALDFSTTTFTVDPASGMFTVPPGPPTQASPVPMDGLILQMKSTGDLPDGLQADTDYCVVNPALSNSFQLRLGNCSGSLASPTNAGLGTHSFVDRGRGSGYIMAWPPAPDEWIVVRTATPDSEFCPDGVRCMGSIWHTKMASFVVPAPQSPMSLQTGMLTHNWRFTGLEFTHADASAEVQTSTDPMPFMSLLSTNASNGFITLDRCYIHGLGFPNRLYRAIQAYDGDTMSIINSDLERLDYWHPYRTGVQPSTAAQNTTGQNMLGQNQFQISPGKYNLGATSVTLPSVVTITVSGQGSGTALVYVDLTGVLEVALPQGLSGSCVGYTPCKVSSAAAPAFPIDAAGRLAVGEIATIAISNGVVTGSASTGEPSVNDTEGALSLIAGLGPGPFLIENNLISGTGISIFFDDGGAGAYFPHDYTIRRNLFTAPLSQFPGSAQSDGFHYFHRNFLEWKNGSRILVEGNVFENNFGDVIPLGSSLLLTTRSGGFTSDVDISWNTFRNSAGVLFVGTVGSLDPVSVPVSRVRIGNNLIQGIDGNMAIQPSDGYTIGIGGSLEDVVMDHNAVYNPVGGDPGFLWDSHNLMEGVALTNSLLWVNNDADRYGLVSDNPQGCSGIGRTLMDCMWVSGTGTPAYQFTNNLMVAGWADSKDSLNPVDPAQLSSYYSGLDVTIASAAQPAAISQMQASGGQGPNMAVLAQMQGEIGQPVAQNATANGFDVTFSAPDPGKACYVLYGIGPDIANFDRTPPDTANLAQRLIHVGPLLPHRTYRYAVVCSGAANQPAGLFATLAGGAPH